MVFIWNITSWYTHGGNHINVDNERWSYISYGDTLREENTPMHSLREGICMLRYSCNVYKDTHRRKTHQCSHCEKAFNKKSDLTKHIKVHTVEKLLQCSHCEMTFVQRGHLTYHMKIHTGERLYSCTHCGNVFACKGILVMHMRIHIGETISM